jgi:predicted metal-binding protein
MCEFCRCEESYNFHHFIPRTLHTNKWFQKNHSREEMQHGINVCKQCHSMIHDTITSEKKLGRSYNSLDKLLGQKTLAAYVRWKRKKHGLRL